MAEEEFKKGKFVRWEWNDARACWEYFTPHRIYPIENRFVVSSCDVWHDGTIIDFNDAEIAALCRPKEDKSDG